MRSSGEALTSLPAPVGDDPPTTDGRHPCAKAVSSLANNDARLKRPFHLSTPVPRTARCIRARWHRVNAATRHARMTGLNRARPVYPNVAAGNAPKSALADVRIKSDGVRAPSSHERAATAPAALPRPPSRRRRSRNSNAAERPRAPAPSDRMDWASLSARVRRAPG